LRSLATVLLAHKVPLSLLMLALAVLATLAL
jgi:hypothetical protein